MPLVVLSSMILTIRQPSLVLLGILALEVFTPSIPFAHTTLTLAKLALLAALAAMSLQALRTPSKVKRLPAPIVWLRTPLPTLILVLFGLIVATALTGISAHYRGPVVRETAKAIEYLLILLFSVYVMRTDRNMTIFPPGFALLIMTVALLALAEEWTGAPSVFRAGLHLVPRIAGPLEGPNQLAAYLGIGIPVLFALAQNAPTILLSSALSIAIVAEMLTFSRGGIATTGIALAILLLRRPWRWQMINSITLTAILIGFLGACYFAGSGIGHLTTLSNEGATGGVGHRGQLWHAAFVFWQHAPWLGIGAGNFERELPLVGVYGVHTHANSLYFQALAEGGIILFIATVASVFVPLVLLAKRPDRNALACGTFAAGIGLALHQLVDTLVFYPKIGLLWWMLIGLTL